MTRRAIAVVAALAALGVASISILVRSSRHGATDRTEPEAHEAGTVTEEALARLRGVPFYRGLVRPEAVRAATVGADGVVHVELDLPALVRPRLASRGLARFCELLPHAALGSLRIDNDRSGGGIIVAESWLFEGPSPLLDLLDRTVGHPLDDPAWEALPGTPSAVAAGRLMTSQLSDPNFGGDALRPWRERVEIAERLLGRPLRAEIAEDLAGPVVFALYETAGDDGASALVVLTLKRSDRLRGLLDTALALGALTERVTVRRYRDVPTGSFRPLAQGPELALAVDGDLFLAASSRALLEAAIDARRSDHTRSPIVEAIRRARGSWSAIAASPFVARGWGQLARSEESPPAPGASHEANVTPDRASSWRLEGRGPSPAITADPVVPFLRSVIVGRQREAG